MAAGPAKASSIAPYEKDAIMKMLLNNLKWLKTLCQTLKFDDLTERVNDVFEQNQEIHSLKSLIHHLIAIAKEIYERIHTAEAALTKEQVMLREACTSAETEIAMIQSKKNEINSLIDAIIEKIRKELFSYPQEIRESAMDIIDSALADYDQFNKDPEKFQAGLSKKVSKSVEESLRGVVEDIQKDIRHELRKVWDQIKDSAYHIFQQILLFDPEIASVSVEHLHKNAYNLLELFSQAYDTFNTENSFEINMILRNLRKIDVIEKLDKREDKYKIRSKASKFGYIIGLVAGVILMGTVIVMNFDLEDFIVILTVLIIGVGLCGFAGAIGGVLVGEFLFVFKEMTRGRIKKIRTHFKQAYQDAVNRELESGKIAQLMIDICFEPLKKRITDGISSLSEPLQYLNIELKKRESLIISEQEQLRLTVPEVQNLLIRTQELAWRFSGKGVSF